MHSLRIPLMFYPSICTWICPNTLCAMWPDFASASTLSKERKKKERSTLAFWPRALRKEPPTGSHTLKVEQATWHDIASPVICVMPKMICRMNSMIFSDAFTPRPVLLGSSMLPCSLGLSFLSLTHLLWFLTYLPCTITAF
eukprot:454478-Pelagomonas_calceolata.AAC.3